MSPVYLKIIEKNPPHPKENLLLAIRIFDWAGLMILRGGFTSKAPAAEPLLSVGQQ